MSTKQAAYDWRLLDALGRKSQAVTLTLKVVEAAVRRLTNNGTAPATNGGEP